MAQNHVPMDSYGHLLKGTTVHGKPELAHLLHQWLDASTADTIGDIGSFGRKPWVRVELGRTTVVLHADTKRIAVKEYVEDVRRRSADVTWYVVSNRRGNVNKVLFREDKQETPGWYCYVTRPFTAPGEL